MFVGRTLEVKVSIVIQGWFILHGFPSVTPSIHEASGVLSSFRHYEEINKIQPEKIVGLHKPEGDSRMVDGDRRPLKPTVTFSLWGGDEGEAMCALLGKCFPPPKSHRQKGKSPLIPTTQRPFAGSGDVPPSSPSRRLAPCTFSVQCDTPQSGARV